MAEKDMAEKTLAAYNDVFSDIINVLLFDGNNKIKEDELEQASARSIYKADGRLREQERDIAKYWKKHSIRLSYQISYELDENGKRRRNRNPRYPVIIGLNPGTN